MQIQRPVLLLGLAALLSLLLLLRCGSRYDSRPTGPEADSPSKPPTASEVFGEPIPSNRSPVPPSALDGVPASPDAGLSRPELPEYCFKVLRADSREPVDSATLHLDDAARSPSLARSSEAGLLVVSAGLIEPTGLGPRTDTLLRLRAPGLVPMSVWLGDGGPDPASAKTILMPTAIVLDVIVTDSEGRGLGDVLVSAYSPRQQPLSEPRREPRVDPAGPRPILVSSDSVVGARKAGLEKLSGRTNASGVARLEPIAPCSSIEVAVLESGRVAFHGVVPVQASSPGYAEARVELPATTTCTGVLRDASGVGIAFCDVQMIAAEDVGQVSSHPEAMYFRRSTLARARTTTDAEGRFVMERVPGGLWYCGPGPSRSEGCWDALAVPALGRLFEVDASRRSCDLSLSLPRGLFISGTVRDQAGMGVSGVTVIAADGKARGFVTAESAVDGAYCVGPLDEGTFDVTVASPEHSSPKPRPVRAGSRDADLSVVAGLSLPLRVVVSETGSAGRIGTIWLRSAGVQQVFELGGSTADVSIPYVGDAPHDVLIRTVEGAFAWNEGIQPTKRSRAIRMRAATGGRIRVVTDDPGLRILAAYRGVEFLDATWEQCADGAFAAPAGDVRVILRRSGGPDRDLTVHVAAGLTAKVTEP